MCTAPVLASIAYLDPTLWRAAIAINCIAVIAVIPVSVGQKKPIPTNLYTLSSSHLILINTDTFSIDRLSLQLDRNIARQTYNFIINRNRGNTITIQNDTLTTNKSPFNTLTNIIYRY